ncbi:MAG: TolB family protein [Kiritimatiellia bacterium]|jgi:hypothetical protein|uniref:TolB family protein n=1 Tax=Atribacter sp. TaxID=2847780 RepID=UPI003D992C0F
MKLISDAFDWQCLTPGEGHFMFGYYDRCAWDATGQHHLALQIPQQSRLPEPGETAEVGIVERGRPGFQRLATTQAWCHQQGAMTLWLPQRPGCFIYNDFIEEANGRWKPVARIYDLARGLVGQYDRPVYAMSPDGRLAAALDFSRIPRRGYSYARATFKGAPPDLDNDGLWILDLETGKTRLVASYRALIEAHPLPYDLEQGADCIWLNHAIFNCDGSRVMVLFRTCANPASPWPWHTYMFTMRVDGGELACPLPHTLWRESAISHQIWGRAPGEILIDANWCGRGYEYVVFDSTRQRFQANRISKGMGPMGHTVFSPDGRWMAADTYSIDGVQRLSLVRVSDGALTEVGRFRHQAGNDLVDVRCDLHPRWSSDGRVLTVDSIHDGHRRIYALDVSPLTV